MLLLSSFYFSAFDACQRYEKPKELLQLDPQRLLCSSHKQMMAAGYMRSIY